VTGCRRGIGMALAEALAEAGADIIGVSASLKERGEEVATRVTKLSRKFTGFQCDLSDRQSLHDLTRKITGTPIDILVNNAGTIRRAPAAEYSDEDWDNVIEVNLSAQFILTREIGRTMLARGRGKIIFIAPKDPTADQVVYWRGKNFTYEMHEHRLRHHFTRDVFVKLGEESDHWSSWNAAEYGQITEELRKMGIMARHFASPALGGYPIRAPRTFCKKTCLPLLSKAWC